MSTLRICLKPSLAQLRHQMAADETALGQLTQSHRT